MIDYKKTTAPRTTITRDMNELTEKVGNVYEIEISKNYEQLPKATLIATQELIDDQLIYRGSNRDDVLK